MRKDDLNKDFLNKTNFIDCLVSDYNKVVRASL